MKNAISGLMAILVSVALTNCEKKTISGEYRSEVHATGDPGFTADLGAHYDFRSDGTYTSDVDLDIIGAKLSVVRKGTYTINGNKVLLTQTSQIEQVADREPRTSTEITHDTLGIEGNGDLTKGDIRYKKQ